MTTFVDPQVAVARAIQEPASGRIHLIGVASPSDSFFRRLTPESGS